MVKGSSTQNSNAQIPNHKQIPIYNFQNVRDWYLKYDESLVFCVQNFKLAPRFKSKIPAVSHFAQIGRVHLPRSPLLRKEGAITSSPCEGEDYRRGFRAYNDHYSDSKIRVETLPKLLQVEIPY